MSKRTTVILLLLLGGITVFVLQYTRESGSPRRGGGAGSGQPAPDFRLKDLNGQEVALSDYKGKIVLLDFWATWCGPCRATMPEMEKLQEEHPNDFTLLAVNLEEPADLIAPYVRDHNIKARVLLDSDGRVSRAYGITGIPMQAIIDKDGVLRHIQSGFYPGMRGDLWAEIEKWK